MATTICRKWQFSAFGMRNLGRRIKLAAESIGGLDALAPLLTGVSRRTLTDWASDKTEPRASSIAEICEMTGVSINWLMYGEGTPKRKGGKDPYSVPVIRGIKVLSDTQDLSEDDMINLPIYSVEASAGDGAVPATEEVIDQVAFRESFLRDLGAHPLRCTAIWAKGDSMQPTIPDGSILIVDLSQTEITNGCLFVINVAGDLLVKRARRNLDASIELISDNSIYPPETVRKSDLDQLRVIGRVVYFCRTP